MLTFASGHKVVSWSTSIQAKDVLINKHSGQGRFICIILNLMTYVKEVYLARQVAFGSLYNADLFLQHNFFKPCKVDLSLSLSLMSLRKQLEYKGLFMFGVLDNEAPECEGMNEYIWFTKTPTQNHACSQRQIHTVHTCEFSQAKTTKDIHAKKAQTPTHPPPTRAPRKCNYTQ